MDKIAEKQARKRADELEMQSWATGTEAKAILLMVGESITVKCPNLQAYQRLRTRLYRIKDTIGKAFTTSLIKNDVTITRIEDEPVNA